MITATTSSGSLEKKLAEFSDKQIKLIARNLLAIQLTEGCNNGCPDCCVGAKKGVTSHIPFDFISSFIQEYELYLPYGALTLYFASDPFDYEFNGHDIIELYDFIKELRGCWSANLVTAVPKDKEEKVLQNMDKVIISVNPYNQKRLEESGFLEAAWNRYKQMEHFNPKNQRVENFEKSRIITKQYKDWKKFGPSHIDELCEYTNTPCCGVIMTPVGIFNFEGIKPSKEHPYGYIATPIDPNNFFVFEIMSYDDSKVIQILTLKDSNVVTLEKRKAKPGKY